MKVEGAIPTPDELVLARSPRRSSGKHFAARFPHSLRKTYIRKNRCVPAEMLGAGPGHKIRSLAAVPMPSRASCSLGIDHDAKMSKGGRATFEMRFCRTALNLG